MDKEMEQHFAQQRAYNASRTIGGDAAAMRGSILQARDQVMAEARKYGENSAVNKIGQPSELETIARRIADAVERAHSIAGQLQAHGDAVFGSYPECAQGIEPHNARSGQIGAITDALDRLDEAMTRLQSEASRNCTLA